MKAIPLSVAFEVASRIALAQGATDPMEHPRACVSIEREERVECLENPSRNVAPAQPAPETGNWIVSETTSPVDYTPIVMATTLSRDSSNGSSMQFSIRCRAGRTELVVAGPALSRAGEGYAISYRINNGPQAELAATPLSSGTGVAFTGDVARLVQSLPDKGEVAIRFAARAGTAQEGHFSLGGLKTVRERFAATCRWPPTAAKPGH
jgi:hypothetical protein